MPPKVLLFGSGAIGTIYVHLLLQSGCDVTAVCRSNHDAAKASGFTIDSAPYGGRLHVRPRVARTCAEAATVSGPEPFDYVLVTTKVLPSSSTPSLIAPAVTPSRTTIVLIQNGIDIEPAYASRFPSNGLISGVVYLPTTQISPAHVSMAGPEKLELGTYPSSRSLEPGFREQADLLVETLRRGGSNVTFYEDIQPRRWFKLFLNAPWNPICALTLARDVAVLQAGGETAEAVVMGVMGEVVRVAERLGYGDTVTGEAAERQLERARERLGTKGIEPSMLVDVRCGRAMEGEAILGNAVRVARKLGVEVPRMEMLYLLIRVLDASARGRADGESLEGDDLGDGTNGKVE